MSKIVENRKSRKGEKVGRDEKREKRGRERRRRKGKGQNKLIMEQLNLGFFSYRTIESIAKYNNLYHTFVFSIQFKSIREYIHILVLVYGLCLWSMSIEIGDFSVTRLRLGNRAIAYYSFNTLYIQP